MSTPEDRLEDLPALRSVGEQLAALAAREQAPTTGAGAAASRLRRQRRRGLLAGLAGSLSVAAVAAAAVGGVFSTGAPVPRSHYPGTRGPLAALVPGTARVLGVRAADPAGGPPWGVRVFRPRSGVGCVQVARIVGGRAGVLGLDGAFAGDHRFHALPAQPALAQACGRRDGAGHLFLEGIPGPLSASGDPRRASARGVPAADRRTVVWGLAGPQATRVIVVAGARRLERDVAAADDGAYLVVLPGAAGPVRREVVYRDGRRCRAGAGVRVAADCVPPPGFTARPR